MPRSKLMSLSNGTEIPVLGFGTAKCEDVYSAICAAIDAGYRHIDTAYVYHNEAEIGRALRDKIRAGIVTREDLWITTKLWNSYHRPEQVEECLQRSLIALGLDYVDLYLVHWPIAFREGHEGRPEDGAPTTTDVDYIDTWRGMEDLYMEGKARNIGVSNFNSEQLDRLLLNSDIRPLVNHVEANIYLNQEQLRTFCGQRGVSLTAYSPLGSPGYKRCQDGPEPLRDPLVASMAVKYSKTPAQVLLRFLIQRGISAIPKSSTPERIKENIDVFDFDITAEDMRLLKALDVGFRRFDVVNLKQHKFYPFSIPF